MLGVSGSQDLSEYCTDADSNSTSDEVHNALTSGSASNPIDRIIQPPTIDFTLEQNGEDLPASLVIQPSQGSYSYLNSDISDYDDWVSPSPSDIGSSAEEDDHNEHQLGNDWRNESYHERRPEIEESLEELVATSVRRQSVLISENVSHLWRTLLTFVQSSKCFRNLTHLSVTSIMFALQLLPSGDVEFLFWKQPERPTYTRSPAKSATWVNVCTMKAARE